jgi:hypothetical protein
MNKRSLVLAAVTTVAMLGCAVAQQPSRDPPGKPLKPLSTTSGPYPQDRYSAAFCARDRCSITVTVNEKCEISVDPQWMGISSKITSPMLNWILKAPPGFSFPEDAIFDKPDRSTLKDPFQVDRSTTPDNFVIRLRTARAPAIFQYGIKVKRGDQVCEILDPPVIVDMP